MRTLLSFLIEEVIFSGVISYNSDSSETTMILESKVKVKYN